MKIVQKYKRALEMRVTQRLATAGDNRSDYDTTNYNANCHIDHN